MRRNCRLRRRSMSRRLTLQVHLLPLLEHCALLLTEPLLLDARPVGESGEKALVLVCDARTQLLDLRGARGRKLRQPRLRARELHGEQRSLDLEYRRALQAARQADHLQGRDHPLGRIPLPPAHPVAIVVREAVVEVVIALAVSDHREHRVVARAVVLGVGPVTPHVGKRVDEEGDVMAPHQAQHPGENQHAPEVVEQQPGRDG